MLPISAEAGITMEQMLGPVLMKMEDEIVKCIIDTVLTPGGSEQLQAESASAHSFVGLARIATMATCENYDNELRRVNWTPKQKRKIAKMLHQSIVDFFTSGLDWSNDKGEGELSEYLVKQGVILAEEEDAEEEG